MKSFKQIIQDYKVASKVDKEQKMIQKLEKIKIKTSVGVDRISVKDGKVEIFGVANEDDAKKLSDAINKKLKLTTKVVKDGKLWSIK